MKLRQYYKVKSGRQYVSIMGLGQERLNCSIYRLLFLLSEVGKSGQSHYAWGGALPALPGVSMLGRNKALPPCNRQPAARPEHTSHILR